MRRREIVHLLGGVAVTWPLALRAQQVKKVSKIGYLSPGSASPGPLAYHDEFQRGLRELGYIEGQISSSSIDLRKGSLNNWLILRWS